LDEKKTYSVLAGERQDVIGNDAGLPNWVSKVRIIKAKGVVKSGSERLPTVGAVLESRNLA